MCFSGMHILFRCHYVLFYSPLHELGGCMIMSMLCGDVIQCLIWCSIESSMILCIKMMMCCLHTMSGIDVVHAFVQVMLWLLCDGAFLYVDVSCCILTFVTMDDMMNVCLRLTWSSRRTKFVIFPWQCRCLCCGILRCYHSRCVRSV